MSSFVNYRLTKCTYYQKLKLSIVGHGTRNMSMSLPPKWQWEGKSILQILILIDKKSRYSRFWCHLLYTRDLSQLSVTIWASGCGLTTDIERAGEGWLFTISILWEASIYVLCRFELRQRSQDPTQCTGGGYCNNYRFKISTRQGENWKLILRFLQGVPKKGR